MRLADIGIKNNIFQVFFSIVLAFCSVSIAEENNGIRQDIRIGVIDVGSKEAPDSFSQFLWINIVEKPNIVLVEREQINKILKEQALNLKFGDDSDTEHFVKAGEILGADFLLMFESGEPVQGQVPIRFRLVETRYGMKFWDYGLLLDKDEKKHSEQAKEISETIISRLQAKNKYGNFTYVAIGAFRSEELSQNWNWISDELAAGIEQKLVNQPSIVLLERRRTRPLMNERDLVEGLPETLRSSAVFIDGSYRMDRQKNNNSILVTFYGYSNNQKIFTINIEGSSDNIMELSQKASIAITENLNIKHETISMDPAKEAALLIEQAKTFDAFKDYHRARILYETTLAIDPNNMEAIIQLLSNNTELQASYGGLNLKDEKRELYKREMIPLMLNNIDIAEHSIKYYTSIKNKAEFSTQLKNHSSNVYGAMATSINVFQYPYFIKEILGTKDDTIEIFKDFQTKLSNIFPIYLDAVKDYDDYLYSSIINIGLTRSYWWASSPQEYLDNLQGWLELSVLKGSNNLWFMNILASFNFTDCPLWPKNKENEKLYTTFLEKLTHHANPMIRFCAHKNFISYYIDFDAEKVQYHYKSLVKILLTDFIPEYPELSRKLCSQFMRIIYLNNDLKKIGERNVAQANIDIFCKITDYLPILNIDNLSNNISSCYTGLERVGETQQAISFLNFCKDKITQGNQKNASMIDYINSCLLDLHMKYPELVIDIDEIPKEECIPITLLKYQDINDFFKSYHPKYSDDCFKRLLIDNNNLVIVCIWGGRQSTRCGIIRLDPEKLTIKSTQEYELPIDLSKVPYSNIQILSEKNSPISAISDDTIYVSIPAAGIIIFQENSNPKLLGEENGLPSSLISSMDAIGERIYALTGPYTLRENGLFEINYKTNKTRILISPRNREDKHSMDGQHIISLAADKWSECLWFSAITLKGTLVYNYNLKTNQVIEIPTETIQPLKFGPGYFIRQEQFLNIISYLNIYSIDISNQNNSFSFIPNTMELSNSDLNIWQFFKEFSIFAGNNENIIATGIDKGSQEHTLIINKDQNVPKELTGTSLPPAKEIREFANTKKGFLVLTRNCLYLIPHKNKNNDPQAEITDQ